MLVKAQIKQLKKFFYERKADCVCGVVHDNPENIKKAYTLNLNEENIILNVMEKPEKEYNSFKGTGYCMMSVSMLECLSSLAPNRKRNEYEMGDWINLAVNRKMKCLAYEIATEDYNINEQCDLASAKKNLSKSEV